MIARYGDAATFRRIFDPVEQARLCRDVERIFTGDAPPLARISNTYGVAEAEIFVMLYIRDLSEYAGVRDKMTPRQMHETAAVILNEYGHLTVSELIYFFFLFKAGRFGHFYGAVDGIVITAALREFMAIRDDEIERISRKTEKERRRAESEYSKRHCLTYEEYKELNWLYNLGYEKPNNSNDKL